jgi:hypothetical protein
VLTACTGLRWRVLDAIIRVTFPRAPGTSVAAAMGAETDLAVTVAHLPPWRPAVPDVDVAGAAPCAAGTPAFSVVHHEAAADRIPANRYDLNIMVAAPGSVIQLPTRSPSPTVPIDVPFLPGARLLGGVLSRAECAALVAATESVGYVPDEVLAQGGGYVAAGELRAGNMVWLVDDSVLQPFFQRVAAALPQARLSPCPAVSRPSDADHRSLRAGRWPG